eukprot:4788690-Pyramimonas_sp.AAC.1
MAAPDPRHHWHPSSREAARGSGDWLAFEFRQDMVQGARGPCWTGSCEAPWGAAIRGNAVVREVFLRAIDEEVAGRLGVPHGRRLLDIA